MKPKRLYLWQKFVEPRRIDIYEANPSGLGGGELAIITRPDRKSALFEIACRSRKQARELVKEFGGRVEKLPANWQKRLDRDQKTRLIKIGKRLVILNVGGTSASRAGRTQSRRRGPSYLLIPAGTAFGTGEHATTAMSLRLLEQATRGWKPSWAFADLGTGSGILALAAKCFGARRVLAIDNDPAAIATAKTNARLNKIDNIDFEMNDVLRIKRRGDKFDVIAANLFSELIITVLPAWKTRVKRRGWLILSGVLRKQENDLLRALRQNKIDIVDVRRRGKWIAVGAALS